jgi:hypothetical protein
VFLGFEVENQVILLQPTNPQAPTKFAGKIALRKFPKMKKKVDSLFTVTSKPSEILKITSGTLFPLTTNGNAARI